MSGKKVALILSGCGVYDGSEVTEVVSCLIHLSRAGVEVSMYAPNVSQMHVIDHTTGKEMKETRNVLVESARIARGSIKALDECNVTHKTIYEIDGAFELPLIASKVIEHHDAVICLGAVIKGDTAHFEYVAGECARGLQNVMLAAKKPVLFGVLTTYTLEQAKERALNNKDNKGYQTAYSALKLCQLCKELSH